MPKNVHVTAVDKSSIRGCPGAKLEINIRIDVNSHWEIQTWAKDEHITKYVFKHNDDEVEMPQRLPIGQAKIYYDNYYHSLSQDKKQASKATAAAGSIAAALIRLLAEEGRVSLTGRFCNRQRSCRCSIAFVKNVMSRESLAQYNQVVNKYGWDIETLAQERAFDILKEKSFSTMANSADVLEHLQDACQKFLRDFIGDDGNLDYIREAAWYIAMDAIATSTVIPGQACRYFSPVASADVRRTVSAVTGLLFSPGLYILHFRRLAFSQLLSNLDDLDDQDLIVTSNGYVTGMAVLWQCSTRQGDALGIKYLQGNIQKDGIPYTSIREIETNGSSFKDISEPITLCPTGVYSGIAPQSENVSFSTSTSIKGDRLFFKQYMQRPKTNPPGSLDIYSRTPSDQDLERKWVSWMQCISILATASHVGRGHELVPAQEEELAMRLHEQGVLMQWRSVFNSKRLESGAFVILKTNGNELLRFLAAASWDENVGKYHGCAKIVIRHGSPLMSCIQIAQNLSTPRVIIC